MNIFNVYYENITGAAAHCENSCHKKNSKIPWNAPAVKSFLSQNVGFWSATSDKKDFIKNIFLRILELL